MNYLGFVVKSTIWKVDVSASLYNLLLIQSNTGNFEGDPRKAANQMIYNTWSRSKAHVDWRTTRLPHKVAFVALALSERLEETKAHDPSFNAYSLALGTAILTAKRKFYRFEFSSLDNMILVKVMQIFDDVCQEIEARPLFGEIEELLAAQARKSDAEV